MAPEENDELEAGLADVTDEEWLMAHEQLAATGAIPPAELEYIWDPTVDPKSLIGPDEKDLADG